MKLCNGWLKAIKTLLTLDSRFSVLENEISELRSDVNRLESRIDKLYQLLLEKLVK